MNCPSCGRRQTIKALNTPFMGASGCELIQVHVCPYCDAILGTCYKGELYDVVLPYWHEGEDKPENYRYYDLEVLGSKGIERWHGWMDRKTRRIVQTG